MFSIRGIIGHLTMKICGVLPVKRKVVFSCFDGKTFGDSPKAIFDVLRKSDPSLEIIWLMYDETTTIPGAKVVRAYSLKALYHQATAKVWIFNSRQREWVAKRKTQLYIQTWHAGVTMKKVEKDAVDKLPQYYINEAKHDSKMADYLISASKWNTDNYRQAFWYTGEILEIGIPRSDVFYQDHSFIKEKVFGSLNINKDSFTVLYAPTFRNDGALDSYNIAFDLLIGTLEQKWPGEWSIIVRLHPNIQANYRNEYRGTRIVNGSTYPDINELIIASDLLITDYSSCMFDALEIEKKVILYTPDKKEYLGERGTYFEFLELPFPTAETNEELFHIIAEFDECSYKVEGQEFIRKCGIFNDGSSSQKIVEIIEKAL